MIIGLSHVNGYPVIAQMKDTNSETAQDVVVCQKTAAEYVVWTVAVISGKVDAWNGYYTRNYQSAMTNAISRLY